MTNADWYFVDRTINALNMLIDHHGYNEIWAGAAAGHARSAVADATNESRWQLVQILELS